MDVLVSMTFGRPPMTSSLSITPETLDTSVSPGALVDAETFKLMFSKENVKLSVILEGILQRIYRPWLTRDVPDSSTSTSTNSPGTFQVHHNLDTVVEIQGQLDNFQQSVTPFLSWIKREEVPESAQMSASDQHIMEINRNVLQARFIYIHLILYRPILSQLAADSASSPPSTQSILSRDGLRSSFALECSKSCVEAAKRLLHLVHGNYATDKSDVWWWNGLCEFPYWKYHWIGLTNRRLCCWTGADSGPVVLGGVEDARFIRDCGALGQVPVDPAGPGHIQCVRAEVAEPAAQGQ